MGLTTRLLARMLVCSLVCFKTWHSDLWGSVYNARLVCSYARYHSSQAPSYAELAWIYGSHRTTQNHLDLTYKICTMYMYGITRPCKDAQCPAMAFLWASLKCCTNIWPKFSHKCNHFFGIDNLFLSPHSPSPKVARVQIEVLLDSKSAQASLTIWHIHHTDRPPSAREKQFRKKTNAIDVIKEIHFSINLVESATSIHRHTRTHTSLFT